MISNLTWRSEDDPPKEVRLTDFTFEPFSAADFQKVDLEKRKPMTLPFRVSKARASSDHFEFPQDARVTASTQEMNFSMFIDAACLVEGGWLPPGLSTSQTEVCLLDRNIVGHFLGLAKNRSAARNEFSSMINRENFYLNPLAHVIERNVNSSETPKQIIESLIRDCDRLKSAFPDAKYLPFADIDPEYIADIVKSFRREMQAEDAYLAEAAPLVAKQHPKSEIKAAVLQLLSIADRAAVHPGNFVVLATLSSLLMRNRRCAATRILKPENPYRIEKLRNASSDFLMMKLLCRLIPAAPQGHTVTYVTRDRGLVEFWSSLKPRFTSGKMNVTLSLPDEVFPGLHETAAGDFLLRKP